jgi:hypothetical protein
MAGVILAVLVTAFTVGFVGRLVMPGRHGLMRLMWSDPRLVRRFVVRDVELRWETGAGLLGATAGYTAGRVFDAWAGSTTETRWVLLVVLSVVFTGISIASGVIENSRFTREMGIQGGTHA